MKRFKAGPLRLARLVSLILFLLLCGGWLVWLSRPRPCERCKWEDRLDADLASIEHHGVKEEDLALAARAACGGYIVRIENEELYAYPFGWEALPQFWEVRQKLPHNFLVLWTKMLCAYPGRVPDVTFVMNSFDKLCVEDRLRNAPIISWGKDTVANDAQILMPYWTFLEYQDNLAKLGVPGPPWDARKETAIWRGSTTGGTFELWNWKHFPRSQLVIACANSKLCDAKFTSYPDASKETIAAIKAAGGHASPMNLSDFLNYKYIIVNDGNMAPSSRLSLFLQSGSLLFKQDSPSIEFYYDDLKPYVHYVPLSYNYGDVELKIKWAMAHDSKAQEIAANARAYALRTLTDEHVLCYMFRLITRYARTQRFQATAQHRNSTFQHVPKRCPQKRTLLRP